ARPGRGFRIGPGRFGAAGDLSRAAVGPRALAGGAGVTHTPVVDAGHALGDRVADRRELAQRQVALVELAVGQAPVGPLADQRVDAGGGRLGQRAGRALDGVREHGDRDLLGAGARAGVAVVRLAGQAVVLGLHHAGLLGVGRVGGPGLVRAIGLVALLRGLLDRAPVEVLHQR